MVNRFYPSGTNKGDAFIMGNAISATSPSINGSYDNIGISSTRW